MHGRRITRVAQEGSWSARVSEFGSLKRFVSDLGSCLRAFLQRILQSAMFQWLMVLCLAWEVQHAATMHQCAMDSAVPQSGCSAAVQALAHTIRALCGRVPRFSFLPRPRCGAPTMLT